MKTTSGATESQSAPRRSSSSSVDTSSAMPPAAVVEQLYADLLEETLVPPAVRERLVDTQSLEKKWTFIQIHHRAATPSQPAHTTSAKPRGLHWGERERSLLTRIASSHNPDIQSLLSLKVLLSSANREVMSAFLDADGVAVLLKAVLTRTKHRVMEEVDAAVLYEILLCCKLVMNNAVGMKGFLSVSGSIDAIALALRLEFKHLALLVLEMLSAICYSEASTHLVLRGMRLLARTHNETVLAGLANALLTQDVEMKSAILRFVNCLLLGVSAEVYAQLRADLSLCSFDVKCEQALRQVEDEVELVENSTALTPSPHNALSQCPTTPTQANKPDRDKHAFAFPSRDDDEQDKTAVRALLPTSSTVEMDKIYKTPEPCNNMQSSPMMSNPYRTPQTPKLSQPSHTTPTHNTHTTQPALLRQKTPRLSPRKTTNTTAGVKLVALAGVRETERESASHTHTHTHAVRVSLSGRATAASRKEGELVTAALLPGCLTRTPKVVPERRWYAVSRDALSLLLCDAPPSLDALSQRTHTDNNETERERDSERERERERSTAKVVLPIGAIIDIRATCSDVSLSQLATRLNLSVFEIVFTRSSSSTAKNAFNVSDNDHSGREETRCFAADSRVERDAWMAALHSARQAIVISKSTYFTQQTFLELKAAFHYAEQFKKLYTEYCAFMMEEKAFSIIDNDGGDSTDGSALDLNDVQAVFRFLCAELTACGTSDKLLCVLRELLCVPASSEALWDAIYAGIRNVRRMARKGTGAPLDKAFPETTIRDVLHEKAEKEGAAYKQMSKLALSVMSAEKEIESLKMQLKDAKDQLGEPALVVNKGARRESLSPNLELSKARHQVHELQSLVERLQQERDTLQRDLEDATQRLSSHTHTTHTENTHNTHTPTVTAVDPRYEKFDKMKKMLPEGAVRQKMAMEGFTANEIDDYFAGKLIPSTTDTVTSPSTAAAELTAAPRDPRFDKFDKMKKMLPEGAVRQKMAMEGFTTNEIDDYFAGKIGAAVESSSSCTSEEAVSSSAAAAVDPRYEKFDKMKKMLPEGAVRQKMAMEGFTANEIDDYFAGKIIPSTTATVTTAVPCTASAPAVNPKFDKFDKMKKMLPEGAVRQKMAMEGFTTNEIDDYFAGKISTFSTAVTESAAAPRDPRYEKFDKMKKMLPEGAVRQKMSMEGFTANEIDDYFAGKTTPAPSTTVTTSAVNPKTEKFEKMKKMLPEGAVRQKMAMEGLTQDEINAFFGVPSTTTTGGEGAVGKRVFGKPSTTSTTAVVSLSNEPAPAVKLKNLFWSKIERDALNGTFWSVCAVSVKLRERERRAIESWFAAKAVVVREKEKSLADSEREKNKSIAVIDAKRTQNVLIALGKLRRDAEEILQMVVLLDPAVLTVEITQTLVGILPTTEEVAAFKEYTTADRMDAASRLFFHLLRVPRLTLRLECHDLAFTWFSSADDLVSSLDVMRKALWELTDSQGKLETIFALILAVGNHLNWGTKFGDAVAIKYDTLSKCATLKATDTAQGSLLNYLAHWAASERSELLSFSESWIGVWAAADLSFKQVLTDLSTLDSQVQRVVAEHTRLTTSSAETLLGLDHKPEPLTGPLNRPLLLRLNAFLDDAKPRLTELQIMAREIEHDLERLMARYGETYRKHGSDEDPAKKFFGLLVTFTRNFLTAHAHNVRRQKAAEKAARLAAEAALKLEQKKDRERERDKDKQREKEKDKDRKTKRERLSLSANTTTTSESERVSGKERDRESGVTSSEGERERDVTYSADEEDENIFGRFYSLDTEPVENVMEKFRRKLRKSMRFSLSPQQSKSQLLMDDNME